MALHQSGAIVEYCTRFEMWAALWNNMLNELLKGAIINGLAEKVDVDVRMFGPEDLADAMAIAQKVEDCMISLDCVRAQHNRGLPFRIAQVGAEGAIRERSNPAIKDKWLGRNIPLGSINNQPIGLSQVLQI